MKNAMVLAVLGLALVSVGAFSETPAGDLAARVTQLEKDVTGLKAQLAAKPVIGGDVVVSYKANYLTGSTCASFYYSGSETSDQFAAKVVKKIDCRKQDNSPYSVYLVQFLGGTFGTFMDTSVIVLNPGK